MVIHPETMGGAPFQSLDVHRLAIVGESRNVFSSSACPLNGGLSEEVMRPR